jgi:hypothetical protein
MSRGNTGKRLSRPSLIFVAMPSVASILKSALDLKRHMLVRTQISLSKKYSLYPVSIPEEQNGEKRKPSIERKNEVRT